ncbi:hypothetical protein DITRI_Ditri06bG0119800 [Diplodiscus trichospermus]
MVTTRSSSRLRLEMTSAEKVASCEDLLQDILVRLPTKSLLKFKLVSKQWLSLISSPNFGNTHTRFLQDNRSLKPQALFLDVMYKKPPSKFKFLRLNPKTRRLPLFDFIDAQSIRILQSCYGLILCVSQSNNGKSYFVCNPVIKKFRMISFPKHGMVIGTKVTLYNHVGVNLAFDPVKSPHYKILSIWQEVFSKNDHASSTTCQMYFDIFSSETDSWSVLKVKSPLRQGIKFDRAVLFNDAFHWDSSLKESLYFDPYSESLKTMPMPTVPETWNRYFGESGGHLHIVATLGFSNIQFQIFEMEEDYSNWFLKYNLYLDAKAYVHVPRRRKTIICSYLLSCAIQYDEEKGDSMLAIFAGGFAISYNLVYNTEKRLRCSKIDDYKLRFGSFRASCHYFETLACI